MTMTKSPVAKRKPCTYAVPSPSFASRGRSCCAQATRLRSSNRHRRELGLLKPRLRPENV